MRIEWGFLGSKISTLFYGMWWIVTHLPLIEIEKVFYRPKISTLIYGMNWWSTPLKYERTNSFINHKTNSSTYEMRGTFLETFKKLFRTFFYLKNLCDHTTQFVKTSTGGDKISGVWKHQLAGTKWATQMKSCKFGIPPIFYSTVGTHEFRRFNLTQGQMETKIRE